MKAVAVFPKEKAVRVVDHPEPGIETPTQVKLKMLDVGVCGTDREICAFDYGTPPPGSDYLVIGHESVGQVVEIGADVKTLKVGDVVIPTVRRPCPHATCVACREGRQDFCYTGDFTERGIKERHGFMTEYVVDEARYMNLVPAALREVAVLVEPLTIAEKALMQVWQVQARLPWACELVPGKPGAHCHTAVVLGAGPVGLLGAMALVRAGFDTYVYSKSPMPNPKADLVASIGATYIDADSHSPEEMMRKAGGAVDLVYEAVGASGLAFEVLQHMGPNSVFVFTGVPGRKAPVSVDTDRLMRNLVLKNQVVFGTVNASIDAFRAAIEDLGAFLKNWPEATRALVTGRHPIDKSVGLLTGRAGGIKEVIAVG